MKKYQFFAVFALILLFGLFDSPSVRAQDCNSPVVDKTGIFKDRMSDVVNAVQKLRSEGVDAYVRTFTTFGSFGNIDQFHRSIQSQCPAWQSADGRGRKSNLLVIMMTIKERKVGIYNGERLDAAVKNNAASIISKEMGPRFRDGDFAGGFITALEKISALFQTANNPTPSQPAQPVIVRQPSQPMDLSGLWSFMKWMLILTVLGALGVLGVVFYNSTKKRRGALSKAVQAKNFVTDLINEILDNVDVSIALLSANKKYLSTKEYGDLFSQVNSVKSETELINQRFSTASTNDNLHQKNLSVEECEQAREIYEKLSEALEAEKRKFDQVNTTVKSVKERADNFDIELTKTKNLVVSAVKEFEILQAQGFKLLNAPELLEKAETALRAAKNSYVGSNFSTAVEQNTTARNNAEQAMRSVKEFVKNKQDLDTRFKDYTTRIETVRKSIEDARQIFERISGEFARKSWESVQGNGSTATEAVERSEHMLGEIKNALSATNQDFTKAGLLLTSVSTNLDQAESMVKSIVTLEKSLQKAKKDAASDIAAAERDIKAARKYDAEHDDDINDNVKLRLTEAEELIREAKEELHKEKPDYFEVLKFAKKANDIADEVLNQCRDEHETAERKRKKSVQALRDAKSRVSKAREYIDDHRSTINRNAKDSLSDAERYLKRAQSASDTDDIISLAEAADTFGKEAYDKAKEDVDEERRSRYHSSSSYSPLPTTVVVNNYESTTHSNNNNWGPSSSPNSGGSDYSSGFGSGSSGSDYSPSYDSSSSSGSDTNGDW